MEFNELLGYAAGLLVAISFLFKNIVFIRVINGIGAILFVIYAVRIGAYPVAGLNAFLVLIHIYQLWRLKRTKHLS
ncbi:TPA: YgjV family protein [Pasteurella multocida]|nr:YgjV family protein [Pasteurella multocida]